MSLVWITGASRGIGEALAYAVASSGYDLILSARNKESLERVANTCRERGAGSVDILVFDLLDQEATATALKSLPRCPDIVVCNAGVSQRSRIADTKMQVFIELYRLNYLSIVQISLHFLQQEVRKRKDFHIVYISSIAGIHGIPLRAGYSSAKSALDRFSETLQAESEDDFFWHSNVVLGASKTNISFHALQGDHTKYEKQDPAQEKAVLPGIVAKKVWKSIRKKKKHIFVGMEFRHWLLYWVHSFFPRLATRLLSRAYRKGKVT